MGQTNSIDDQWFGEKLRLAAQQSIKQLETSSGSEVAVGVLVNKERSPIDGHDCHWFVPGQFKSSSQMAEWYRVLDELTAQGYDLFSPSEMIVTGEQPCPINQKALAKGARIAMERNYSCLGIVTRSLRIDSPDYRPRAKVRHGINRAAVEILIAVLLTLVLVGGLCPP